MLGYCGENCENCPAYQGTVNYDMSLLEKAAGSFWNGAYSAKDWVCLGCLPADQPFLAKFCAECKIRSCAIGRQVTSCAMCKNFENCPELQKYLGRQSEAFVRTMSLLRERFLERQRLKSPE